MKDKKRSKFSKISEYIWDVFFIIVVVPIILCSMIIITKTILHPYEIPDILGYKLFIVLDENMDKSLEYGDVVITKNVEPKTLGVGNLIAYRNNNNYVTLHKISEISENNNARVFSLEVSEGEIVNSKFIKEDSVEGILVKKYERLGIWLMVIQDVRGLIAIVSFILIIGVISYYIAEKLDKRDEKEKDKNIEKKSDKKTDKIEKQDKEKEINKNTDKKKSKEKISK